jgi:PAS domain S-box-containing protein
MKAPKKIYTKKTKAFDVNMPQVLYKKNYNPKTKEWTIVGMDTNYEKLTGYPFSIFEFNHPLWLKHLHTEDIGKLIKAAKKLESGLVDSAEISYRWLHKDGTWHWFFNSGALIRDSKNKPYQIVGSIIDISVHVDTKRKLANVTEEKESAIYTLQENEEHYKKIIELSHHAIFVQNEDSYKFLNSAAVKLFGGKRPEDIIGKPIFDFIHPDYHEQYRIRRHLTAEERKANPIVGYKIITLQGEVKDVEIAATIFNFQGKKSIQGVIVDVTNLKKAEEAYCKNANELEILNKILMKREAEHSLRLEKVRSASFEEERGVLLVGNAEVKFQKFSKQYYLLQIIFKEKDCKNKDWQFSEISEIMDIESKFDWKKLYNVADAIRKNIAIETGIKDFFIRTTQSLKINPSYLKES